MEGGASPPGGGSIGAARTAFSSASLCSVFGSVKGWNVSRLKPSTWLPGSAEFELSQPTVSDLLLVCTHLGDGNWRLHLAEEPPESGQPVLARIRPAKDFEERPAPAGVVEAIVDSLDVINRGGQ